MKVLRIVVALGAGTAIAACTPAGSGKMADANAASDTAGVGKVRDGYTAAFKAGDAAAIAALYTSDGMSQGNMQPTANGTDAITAANKPLFDQYTLTSVTITPVKTEASGQLAYDIGTYSFVGAPKAKGDTLKASGRYVVLLRKQADGSWKAIADMDNGTTPMVPPPPPAKKK